MRFLGNILQCAAIVLALCVLNQILPLCVLNCYKCLAGVFLSFNLAVWITELTQDCFFTAKVDVKHKAVLITGCDTGFGNAIAKILDLRGYRVFACCLDTTCDGASELEGKCSSNLKILQMDVTDHGSVERAVESMKEELGNSKLWAVINNAGVTKGFHTELCRMKDFDMCMQINALGVVRVTKAFLPFLRQSKGRVVNVCSMAGRNRCPWLGPYTMSKCAAIAFSEVLMQEMREFGIRVVTIEPEFFRTPMCSEEYVMNYINESMSELKEDVEYAYGQKYIEKSKELYFSIVFRRCSDVQRVFNALESAVSLQNPADCYKPTRNIFTKLLFFLSERVPRILNEITVMFLLFFAGLPAPRTGTNVFYRLYKM